MVGGYKFMTYTQSGGGHLSEMTTQKSEI